MDFSFEELTFEELTSPKVKALYAYWIEKRGDRAYPSLQDINLDELADIAPYLMFAEVHYAPFKIHYSSLGAQIMRFYGRDLTDLWLHDVFDGPMLRHFEVPHRMAITHPLPLLGVEEWPGTEASFEWGIFPLSDNGTIVNCNLVIEDYSHLNRDELPDFAYKK